MNTSSGASNKTNVFSRSDGERKSITHHCVRSKVLAQPYPSQDGRGASVSCLFQSLVAAGISGFVATSLHSLPLPPHGLLLCYLPRTLVTGVRAHWITWDDSCVSRPLTYLCKDPFFPRKLRFTVSTGWVAVIFGDHLKYSGLPS